MGKRQHFLSTAGSQRKTGMFREAELRRGSSVVFISEKLPTLCSPNLAPSSLCHPVEPSLGAIGNSISVICFFCAQAASWLGEEKASLSVSWCSVTNQPPAQHLETIMLILASLLVSRPGSDTTDLVWACLCICGQLAVQLGLAG